MIIGIYFDQETRSFSTKAEAKLENQYNKLRAKGKSHEDAIAKLHKRNNTKKILRRVGGGLLLADTARSAMGGAFNTKKAAKAFESQGFKDGKSVARINQAIGIGQAAVGAGLIATSKRNHAKTKEAISKLDEKYKK